jgi:hypothetical protein
MIEQGVNERARFVAGGRMNDEPLRLVDNDNIRVLVDDIKRNILG